MAGRHGRCDPALCERTTKELRNRTESRPRYNIGVERLRRGILNLVTCASLLLCIATAALFLRSLFVGDQWIWNDPDCSECISRLNSGGGRLRYSWHDTRAFSPI